MPLYLIVRSAPTFTLMKSHDKIRAGWAKPLSFPELSLTSLIEKTSEEIPDQVRKIVRELADKAKTTIFNRKGEINWNVFWHNKDNSCIDRLTRSDHDRTPYAVLAKGKLLVQNKKVNNKTFEIEIIIHVHGVLDFNKVCIDWKSQINQTYKICVNELSAS